MNNQVKNELVTLRKTIESARGLYHLACKHNSENRFTVYVSFYDNKAVKRQVKRLAKLAYQMNNDKSCNRMFYQQMILRAALTGEYYALPHFLR